ncbi:uncharacterized protein LOC6544774 [Drosophila erecta]|uniref:Uncharacterized protein n=1 Tax=Drosophila erecta TaxID=7220 RepID=B3NFU4_DROER|nr:uncharacterized protein LOC6544774 [Drosophila erecta]EDV50706.1 uncharacterized protein Dere_GG15095 [Drosophila erecta]EDV50708.1 uncharacterized protein Dere_GG15096 [Drosophila erecta]
MSSAKHFQQILEKLLIPDNERAAYTKDSEEIQNYVVDELKRVDDTFRQVFDGLSLGGSYLDCVKLNVPDEFDLHMKLKFPYDIQPEPIGEGFVRLKGNFHVISPQLINRTHLQHWLRLAFRKVFDSYKTFATTRGRVYKLSYTLEGYGCAHTILAISGSRSISFDLVPAFEFSGSQWPFAFCPVPAETREKWAWFAIPQKKTKPKCTFMVCAPHWEREIMKDTNNLKNVLRLMKGLRDAHASKLPHLSSYMLKAVLLNRIKSADWERDLGTLLVEMWSHLVDHLRTRRLEFFLAKDHNVLQRMNQKEIKKCLIGAETLLQKLRLAQSYGTYNHLAELFFFPFAY